MKGIGKMKTFGEQLTTARKERGLTQEQLADAMHVTRPAVSHWENGRTLPDWENVNKLSEILDYRFSISQDTSQNVIESNDNQNHETTLSQEEVDNTERKDGKNKWVSWRNLVSFATGVVVTLVVVFGVIPLLNNSVTIDAVQNERIYIAAPSTVEGFKQSTKQVKNQAFISVTPTENPVPLVADANFSNGQGWHFSFAIENQSEIAFTVKELTVIFFINDQIESRSYFSDEQLEMQLGNCEIQPEDSPFQFSMGANNRGLTGVGCSIKGFDANGNTLEFHGYSTLLQNGEE